MKFSIATPVFNGLPWLPLCVASIQDQLGCDGEWRMAHGEDRVAGDRGVRVQDSVNCETPHPRSSESRIPNPESGPPHSQFRIPNSKFSVEHLVQDGGSTDCEWQLVGNEWRITARTDGESRMADGERFPASQKSESGIRNPESSPSPATGSALPTPVSPSSFIYPSTIPRVALPNPPSAISHSPSTNAVFSDSDLLYTLKFVREPDGGMYDAINRAWRRAGGDIIAYLNADEQYLPGTLNQVAREFATKPDLDIVFGDALLINAEGRPLSYRRVVPPSRAHTQVVHLGTLSCAMFFRRRLLDDGFFFDTRWRAIGDAEWVWRVLGSGARVGIINEPLAAFTMTGANLGENPQALAEAVQWRSEAPAVQRGFAPVLRIRHWIQKAIAGAYRPHPVRSAVFTTASPGNRIPFDIPNLGHRWTSS